MVMLYQHLPTAKAPPRPPAAQTAPRAHMKMNITKPRLAQQNSSGDSLARNSTHVARIVTRVCSHASELPSMKRCIFTALEHRQVLPRQIQGHAIVQLVRPEPLLGLLENIAQEAATPPALAPSMGNPAL